MRCEVREPETVASHMFRVALMSLMVAGKDSEAVNIALCHDMAECLTPLNSVSSEDNPAKEAFRDLVKDLPGHVVHLIYGSFRRYENQAAGDLEARLVKDLDKFDMILQAWEYEKRDKRGKYLQQFFDSTATVFTTVPAIKWQRDLLAARAESSQS